MLHAGCHGECQNHAHPAHLCGQTANPAGVIDLFAVRGERSRYAKCSCRWNFPRRICPTFWAVLLIDRDSQKFVNMMPYTDEWKVPHPESKTFSIKHTCGVHATMHFLTNSKDLKAGDLLVLPFDGGSTSIFSRSPAANASSSGYEPTWASA